VARKRDDGASGFDPHEFGARRSTPELAGIDPIPRLFSSRFSPKNLLLYFVLGVVVVAFVRAGVGRPQPKVARSCTTPAFELVNTEVKQYGVIKWSATGPNGTRVVFVMDANGSTAVPTTAEAGLLAAPGPLKDCQASGRFGIRAGEGDHVVTALAVAADGTATVIGTEKILVSNI
jgi:hypothetical protein